MSCDMDVIHERNLEEISELLALPTEWVTGLEEAYMEKFEADPDGFNAKDFFLWAMEDLDMHCEIDMAIIRAYK